MKIFHFEEYWEGVKLPQETILLSAVSECLIEMQLQASSRTSLSVALEAAGSGVLLGECKLSMEELRAGDKRLVVSSKGEVMIETCETTHPTNEMLHVKLRWRQENAQTSSQGCTALRVNNHLAEAVLIHVWFQTSPARSFAALSSSPSTSSDVWSLAMMIIYMHGWTSKLRAGGWESFKLCCKQHLHLEQNTEVSPSPPRSSMPDDLLACLQGCLKACPSRRVCSSCVTARLGEIMRTRAKMSIFHEVAALSLQTQVSHTVVLLSYTYTSVIRCHAL